MDASEFKDYIFGILFLKHLSDAFEAESARIIAYYLENGSDTSEAEEMAEDEDEYVDTFYIAAVAHWDNIKGLSTDINVELNSLKSLRLSISSKSPMKSNALNSRLSVP